MDTIYAYWDAEQIRLVLNGVAILMGMDDYMGLIKVFAILGLFVAVGSTFAKARGEEAGMYFLMLAIWYGALFLPKKDVVIEDTAAGTGTYTVANVPVGLAFFASAESQIGYWLTEAMETVFAIPSDITFQKSGVLFGSRVIQQRMSMGFYKPELYTSLTYFTKECIYPELMEKPALYDTIMKTNNIWGALSGEMNPGRLVQIYNGTAYTTTNCELAYTTLDTQINAHVSNDMLPRLARILNPYAATDAEASTLVASQLPVADDYFLGISQTAEEGIRQAAMINLLTDSTYTVPQFTGDTAAAQIALSTAMASSSANSSYKTMAKIAEGSLPMIRSAIHVVILGLFPIVILMIIIAGSKGGMVLKMYVTTLLWVNLWAPIYALLNFFSSYASAKTAKAAVQGTSGLAYSSYQPLISNLLSDQAITGLLTISVPMIAYALVKAGDAVMANVTSSLTAPANAAAQSAGSQVGLGNTNVGNTSWGNVQMHNRSSWNTQAYNGQERNWSADQVNTAPTSRTGESRHTQVGGFGELTTNAQGTVIGASVPKFDVGANLTGGTQTQLSSASASASSVQIGETRSAIKDIALSSAYGQDKTAEHARAFMKSLGETVSTSKSHGQNWEAGTAQSASIGTQSQRQSQNKEGAEQSSKAGIGFSGGELNQQEDPRNMANQQQKGGAAQPADSSGSPMKTARRSNVSGELGSTAQFKSAMEVMHAASDSTSQTSDQRRAHAARVGIEAANRMEAGSRDEGSRRAAQAYRSRFEDVLRASEQNSTQLSESQSATQTNQFSTGNTLSASFSSGKPAWDAMVQSAGGNVDKALEMANQRPDATIKPTLDAARGFENSQAGANVLMNGGMEMPKSQAEVRTSGEQAVSQASTENRADAMTHKGTSDARVAAMQPASPTSGPDTSQAFSNYNAMAGQNFAVYSAGTKTAKFNEAVNSFAATNYKQDEVGMGQWLKNTWLGATGYEDPQKIRGMVMEAANHDPVLKGHLEYKGGALTQGDVEFVSARVQKYAESKPESFGEWLNRKLD